VSTWKLETEALGQSFEFSWKARNLPPLKNKMLHWQSIDGSMGGSGIGTAIQVRNRGQVKFRKMDDNTCHLQLAISFEVPDVLGPLGNAVSPLVEEILQADMERFKALAEDGKLEVFDDLL
ncbi:hypothetical protein AAMO2058_001506700, partial [Amorphochlora amoebiformis]